MIRFYEAGIKEIDELMELRKTMLREVNSLPDDYVFSKAFRRDSKKIFLSGNQTTFIAAEESIQRRNTADRELHPHYSIC